MSIAYIEVRRVLERSRRRRRARVIVRHRGPGHRRAQKKSRNINHRTRT